jgi:proteasome lid subunit RPN8/RPN11
MRSVHLAAELAAEIARHAIEAYPEECCGLLIAPDRPEPPDAPREIETVERATNDFDGERRRGFVIAPEELRLAERRWAASGRRIVGFYHSHPDHAARPSSVDQARAWPWYTYLVVAATATTVSDLAAFELDPDARVFREVPLTTERGVAEGVTELL